MDTPPVSPPTTLSLTPSATYFGRWLTDKMAESNVDIADLAAVCGVGGGAVKAWRRGVSVPRDGARVAIAQILGVSFCDLAVAIVGGEDALRSASRG